MTEIKCLHFIQKPARLRLFQTLRCMRVEGVVLLFSTVSTVSLSEYDMLAQGTTFHKRRVRGVVAIRVLCNRWASGHRFCENVGLRFH